MKKIVLITMLTVLALMLVACGVHKESKPLLVGKYNAVIAQIHKNKIKIFYNSTISFASTNSNIHISNLSTNVFNFDDSTSDYDISGGGISDCSIEGTKISFTFDYTPFKGFTLENTLKRKYKILYIASDHKEISYSLTPTIATQTNNEFIYLWAFEDGRKFTITFPYQKPIKKTRNFSKLQITKVSATNGKIIITGITDLPTNSIVNVELDPANRPATAAYIGTDTDVQVKNGNFKATLIIPKRPEFVGTPYLISVDFSPYNQPSSIISLVGENGEHLNGPEKVDNDGFRTLDTSTTVSLHTHVKMYTMEKLQDFNWLTPQYALLKFLWAWHDQNWDLMAKYTQKTWISIHSNATEYLKSMFDFRKLVGAKILNATKIGLNNFKVSAQIVYYFGNELNNKIVTVNVIREIAPYTPARNGKWGVNPTSWTEK